MNDKSDQPDRHLEGEGRASHRFNPERAEEFRDTERMDALELNQLAAELELAPGQTVLDLGTGSGALLPWLSDQLKTGGVVIGSDISDDMLSLSREYVQSNALSNVVLIRNQATQTPLVTNTVDRVLIISSLHEFSHPFEMLNDAARVLVSGGRIGIMEWRYEETEPGPPLDHRLPPDRIHSWLKNAGLSRINRREWHRGYDLFTASLNK